MLLYLYFRTVIVVLSGANIAFSLPSPQFEKIKQLVVFGDSFSDNGSGAWKISNNIWPADIAYFGHRFSNGLVWPEVLATRRGWQLNDYAIGGATSNNTLVQGYTGPGSSIPVPSALDQVSAHLNSHRSADLSKTLFAILIGANDALFAGPTLDSSLIIHGIKSAISKLRHAGAVTFLVVTVPDLATLPFAGSIDPSESNAYHNFSSNYRKEIVALASRSRDHIVTVVDGYDLFADFFSRPAAYGFVPNATHASCLAGAYGEVPRSLCTKPDEYEFWDAYHPTRKSHRYLAEFIDNSL